MYQSTDFIFDNLSSVDLGLQLVKVNIDKNIETFVSQRNLVEERVKNNTYLYNIESENLAFECEFASVTPIDEKRKNEISRIFFKDTYTNFIPQDSLKVYNCIAKSGSLNVFPSGFYFSIDFVCSSPFASSQLIAQQFDITTANTNIEINNQGNVNTYIIADIKLKTTGQSIQITNITNGGQFIKFDTDSQNNQLYKDETITVDFKKNRINTDMLGLYRYSNLQTGSKFFDLVLGKNQLKISQPCFLTIYYRNLYLC